jgi:malate dehydrogenase (oxaloacetate-decarboxylating)(NADP+)
MLANGHSDGLVTGATRKSAHVLGLINNVFDTDAEHGATVIGPILSGVDKLIQICSIVATATATATDILNMAVLTASKVG